MAMVPCTTAGNAAVQASWHHAAMHSALAVWLSSPCMVSEGQQRAWPEHLESGDGRVVADLLQEQRGAITQRRLPGLPQDGVEGLAPGLEAVLQARHEPAPGRAGRR